MALDLCSQMTHTVTFKCIGTTKETQYQERLKRIAQLHDRGLQVSCQLKPEPDNPFDSNAIAFECQIDGIWQVGKLGGSGSSTGTLWNCARIDVAPRWTNDTLPPRFPAINSL